VLATQGLTESQGGNLRRPGFSFPDCAPASGKRPGTEGQTELVRQSEFTNFGQKHTRASDAKEAVFPPLLSDERCESRELEDHSLLRWLQSDHSKAEVSLQLNRAQNHPVSFQKCLFLSSAACSGFRYLFPWSPSIKDRRMSYPL
jgi:hypothetical protein